MEVMQNNPRQKRLKMLHEKWGQIEEISEAQKQGVRKELDQRLSDLLEYQALDE